MLTSSRYLTAVSADRCSFCNTPFRRIDGYFEFWRTSDGRHFCSEFCADNAEEAHSESNIRITRLSLILHSSRCNMSACQEAPDHNLRQNWSAMAAAWEMCW